MGASVYLCVSDAQEKNRIACFYGLDYFGRCYYLNVAGYEIAAVDVVDTVHVAGFAGIVGVVVAVFGVLMLLVDVAIADIAVVVAVVGIGDGIGVAEDVAVGSVVASVAPYQRPSKRTHREPSNRFDLPEIFFYNSII